ncbi:uncharacterized protein LOC113472240, partial [Diaphorina citri]
MANEIFLFATVSSVSSAQQVSQSYHSTSSSSEQYFNSAQHQLTNGIPASQNFKPENFGALYLKELKLPFKKYDMVCETGSAIPRIISNSNAPGNSLTAIPSMTDAIEIPVIHETAIKIPVIHETPMKTSSMPREKLVKSHHSAGLSSSTKSFPNLLSSPFKPTANTLLSPSVAPPKVHVVKIMDEVTKKCLNEQRIVSDTNLRPLERSERKTNFENVHQSPAPQIGNVHPTSTPHVGTTHQTFSPYYFSTTWSSNANTGSLQNSPLGPNNVLPFLSSTTTSPMYTSSIYSWTRTKPCISTGALATTKGSPRKEKVITLGVTLPLHLGFL